MTHAHHAPPRPGQLRRRLAVASLILALLVAAFLVYMYVSGKILYAGMFDPLLLLPALVSLRQFIPRPVPPSVPSGL